MLPTEPCYLLRNDKIELWLPDTPLGRKIAERLQREGAELIHDQRMTEQPVQRA